MFFIHCAKEQLSTARDGGTSMLVRKHLGEIQHAHPQCPSTRASPPVGPTGCWTAGSAASAAAASASSRNFVVPCLAGQHFWAETRGAVIVRAPQTQLLVPELFYIVFPQILLFFSVPFMCSFSKHLLSALLGDDPCARCCRCKDEETQSLDLINF